MEVKVYTSAMKSSQKKHRSNKSYAPLKCVRIMDPLDCSSQTDLLNYDIDKPQELSLCKDKVYANQPSDLLEGISEMFIHADLSCNFAKREKKIGWNVLSKSILNKLYPGNAIFNQQLDKLKVEKENFEVEQKKSKKTRKRSKNLLSLISNSSRRMPTINLDHRRSGSLEKEIIQLNNNFKASTQNFNYLVKPTKGRKRPKGGKEYEHIKSKYKEAIQRINLKSDDKILGNFTRSRRRLRPTSACSSPTKLGRSNDSISPKEEKEFTICQVDLEDEVPMREVKDYNNYKLSTIENEYCNTTIKSGSNHELKLKKKIGQRRNLNRYYKKINNFKSMSSQPSKKAKSIKRISSVGLRKIKSSFNYENLLRKKNQPYAYFKSKI